LILKSVGRELGIYAFYGWKIELRGLDIEHAKELTNISNSHHSALPKSHQTKTQQD
jgi:hypothetical protein